MRKFAGLLSLPIIGFMTALPAEASEGVDLTSPGVIASIVAVIVFAAVSKKFFDRD